ncbi:hypothetical protein CmeUKMEL1_05990 [Cryptosporidium meleagridis]|uniref:Uncharacterized protein n=1 Tax=Cryptosporidium meleagridis TaxID=93969 RepID=A0A2P4YZD3_9CRYT|nr:hypothetical protein CmeUKMEL1_05990 [Cryptosporidium meleagridis]
MLREERVWGDHRMVKSEGGDESGVVEKGEINIYDLGVTRDIGGIEKEKETACAKILEKDRGKGGSGREVIYKEVRRRI